MLEMARDNGTAEHLHYMPVMIMLPFIESFAQETRECPANVCLPEGIRSRLVCGIPVSVDADAFSS